jgi:hypothetical protein
MIRDWKRFNSDDIANYTQQVNLFKTDEEILRKNYQGIFNSQILDEASKI